MKPLTERQFKILEFIKTVGRAKNKQITEYFGGFSRLTIIRDINVLLKFDLIERKGKGRSVFYQEKIDQEFLKYINIDNYFLLDTDKRFISFPMFNFNVFKMKKAFSIKEVQELKNLNSNYQKQTSALSKKDLKKELERLSIELSWKSSKIEGNTYSLIDTEILIKESKEAIGHKKEEAIMILNHKKTIDYIIDTRSNFKKLTLGKIESIHSLIVDDLDIEKGIRQRPVGIIGTKYMPLDNQHQIREVMEKMIKMINRTKDPFSKAVFTVAILSYIQPFIDGNKRTARLLGNAVLLAFNICPLSYRSVDESEYKKSIILFYEQNNLRLFKDLFVEQFKFSIKNYFFG